MKSSAMIAAALFGSAALGCGGSSQGGLTNVPAPNRVEQTSTEHHDAIANGPESCPPPGSERDPLPNRAAKCPEQPQKGPAPARSPR